MKSPRLALLAAALLSLASLVAFAPAARAQAAWYPKTVDVKFRKAAKIIPVDTVFIGQAIDTVRTVWVPLGDVAWDALIQTTNGGIMGMMTLESTTLTNDGKTDTIYCFPERGVKKGAEAGSDSIIAVVQPTAMSGTEPTPAIGQYVTCPTASPNDNVWVGPAFSDPDTWNQAMSGQSIFLAQYVRWRLRGDSAGGKVSGIRMKFTYPARQVPAGKN